MESRLILFPAIYKGGELLENEFGFRIDCSSVNILGERGKQAWDPFCYRMRMMYGFFIEFEGIEYGTLNMTQQNFLDTCNGVGNCCGTNLSDRIHVEQFAIEFV